MNDENGRLIEVESYATKTDTLNTKKQIVILNILREHACDYGLDESTSWINKIEDGKCINKYSI
jgi:hypothetical protein